MTANAAYLIVSDDECHDDQDTIWLQDANPR